MNAWLSTAFTAAVMAPSAFAQQQPTQSASTTLESDQVIPAREGETGPLRFETRLDHPIDSYRSKTPEYSGEPRNVVESRPISYDALSKIETVGDAAQGPFAESDWAVGSDTSPMSGEELLDSFGAINAVTSSSTHWDHHARMWFTDPSDGKGYVCSGTMIDAKTMLTAGHCVHGGSGGQWMTNIVVSPGWDGDDDDYGSANGIVSSSWTPWTTSGSSDGDQAYVRLDRPVGFLSSWHGYGYNASSSWWTTTTFNNTGYPGGCFSGAPNQLYHSGGTFDSDTTFLAFSDVSWPCWIGGMSGGGIYYISGGNRFVAANNSHGWGKGAGVTTKYGACKIDSQKFNEIQNIFIPGAYSSSLDLLPLKVRSNSVVQAGAVLGGMSYKVVNASLNNPSYATYLTDVYLSTNQDISIYDTRIQSHSYNHDFSSKSSLNLNVSTGPTIPLTTAPGSYYVGVILNITDDDTTNNDSDGWDAQKITVTKAPQPVLETTGYYSPGNTRISLTSAVPNSYVFTYYSFDGGGPLPTVFGTVFLTPPVRQLTWVQVDGNGSGVSYVYFPAGLAGTQVWMQSLQIHPSVDLSTATYGVLR